MRLRLLLLFLTTAAIGAAAQKKLKQPLTFIPADSVVIWSGADNDPRGCALAADATLTARPVQADASTFRPDLKQWKRTIAPNLTLTGFGNTDANASPAVSGSNSLTTAGRLFLLTGSSCFMDAAERALFNDLMHEVNAEGPVTFEKHTAAQALVNGVGMTYATSARALYVNFYSNSTVHVVTDSLNLIVDQITRMPHDGRIKIRLTAFRQNRYRVRLHLRLPSWAQTAPAGKKSHKKKGVPAAVKVYVNGHEDLTPHVENGYYVIDRAWNLNDEVLFELPVAPRYADIPNAGAAGTGSAAIVSGPLTYAAEGVAADAAVDTSVPPVRGVDEKEKTIVEGRTAEGVTFRAYPYLSGRQGQLLLRKSVSE